MSTKTEIMLPDKLEAGAVIPQCLDNQFVTDGIFSDMVKNNLPYSDKNIQGKRVEATRTELNRALVYAPQTVMNRAFLWNNRVLYSSYKDTKENQNNRQAFMKLIKDKAVIPYLHDRASIEDEPSFDLDPEEIETFKSLLRDIDKISCLRFAVDDQQNKTAIDMMTHRFHEYFLGFVIRPTSLIKQTADGLIPGRDSKERRERVELLSNELNAWKRQLHDVVLLQIDKKGTATRNDFYQEFICRKDVDKKVSIPQGYFIHPSQSPFVLEKKKLFDLRYNINLADSLKRYVFTPADMPMRSALAVDVEMGTWKGDDMVEILSDNMRHTFVEGTQQALNLPFLKDLEIEDVYDLRQLPGWAEYIAVQREILEKPLESLQHLDAFTKALETYNINVADWYYKQKRIPVIEQKYRMIVRIAIKVAGVWIAHNLTGNFYTAALASLIDLPDNALGYTVSLLVDFIPIGRDEVDRQLGYSLDIVNYEANVTKESLIRLVRKAQEAFVKETPPVVKDLANQSKS
jgi:hypothetical protein